MGLTGETMAGSQSTRQAGGLGLGKGGNQTGLRKPGSRNGGKGFMAVRACLAYL